MAAAPAKIFPFLWYATEAEQAATFYASIFPDSRVDRVTTLQSESPSGPPGSVKVVDFTLLGQRFQAMTAGPHHAVFEKMMRDEDPARSKKVTDAMLKMVKFDIAELEKAYRS